jgi:S-adenosylmethionine decarboxylase
MTVDLAGGCEWIIEAHGCNADALRDVARLESLFADLVREVHLHPLSKSAWHQFPDPGGVTGFIMLTESHLACHTFPEFQSICLNLFCCRPHAEWDFESYLKREFGADSVSVRRIDRPYRQ